MSFNNVPGASNLFEALKNNNTKNKGITFIDENGCNYLSYNDLINKARCIAGFLCQKTERLRSEIIAVTENNRQFVPVFWASLYAGIKIVPVASGISDEHKLKIIKVFTSLIKPTLIISHKFHKSLSEYAANNGYNDILNEINNNIIYYEDITETTPFEEYSIASSDIAFIQYSSGSTGFPKGVVLTHKNLLLTVNAFRNKSEIDNNDSFLSWFPLSHDMGLIGWHILPAVYGINQVLIETSLFVRRPSLWMEKASEYKSTILCSPNFGLKHLLSFSKNLGSHSWDLSQVRLLAMGAEPISASLCEEFNFVLAQYNLSPQALTPGYGLAEVGLIATISSYKEKFKTVIAERESLTIGREVKFTDSVSGVSFVSEGSFIPEMEVKITGDNMDELSECYSGHILIRGESVTSGYYNNKKATDELKLKDGWLDTGDIGFFNNGELIITGRAKELIIINGFNFYPHDIERVCLSIDGIELGRIVAAGYYDETLGQEALLIFVYIKGDDRIIAETAQRIKETVLQAIGINVFKVLFAKKIPKTTSGKVQRFILIENYKKGLYRDISTKLEPVNTEESLPVSREQIAEKIIKLIQSVLPAWINNINYDDALIEFGIDSIRGAELLSRLREEFHLKNFEYLYLPALSIKEAASEILRLSSSELNYAKPAKKKYSSFKPGSMFPASYGQLSIYFEYKSNPLSSAYNISFACQIRNTLDSNLLNRAYLYVINRHGILRAAYKFTDKLYYSINNTSNDGIAILEIPSDEESVLSEFVKVNADKAFNLETGQVIRAYLYNTGKNGSIFHLNMHHIAGDAHSLAIIMKEILLCYNELAKNGSIITLSPEADIEYLSFVESETEYLSSNKAKEAETFWKRELSGISEDTSLFRSHENSDMPAYKSVVFDISKKTNARKRNISGFIYYLAVYSYLLHRYTGKEDIVIGIPVIDNDVLSNRMINDELVGYTINTVPLVISAGYKTADKYINNIKDKFSSSLPYSKYPFFKIAEDGNSRRGIISTMFTSLPVTSSNPVMEFAAQIKGQEEITFGTLKISPFHIPQQENLFDISIEMAEQKETTVFRLSYNCNVFSTIQVNRFIQHFRNVSESFILHNVELSSLQILTEDETRLLKQFNRTDTTFRTDEPIIKLIEEQAKLTPHSTAYIYNNKNYSYEWVNNFANAIADNIIRAGIKEGSYIPLFMKKGIELPVAMMAVMKSGCAFVPVDTDAPEERLKVIFNDLASKIVLTTEKYKSRIPSLDNTQVYVIPPEIIQGSFKNPGTGIMPDDPIYGIYTSGTTGIPKCAINLHKGITNRFLFMNDYFNPADSLTVFHSANYIFDTTVYQLFWPLTVGGKTVIPESNDGLNLDEVLNLVQKYKVTYIDLVPSVFNVLVEYFESDKTSREKFASVTHVSVGGEAVMPAFIKKFRKHFPGITLTNIYGPTETSIGVTFYNIGKNPENEIPIGRPISNTKLYILDKHVNQVPPGIEGEIYLGGVCVGSGYLNDPYKTASAFLENKIDSNGGYLYKTGDIGTFDNNGNVFFRGRADEQVKIRGVRIEPDEVRIYMLKSSLVKDAAVVPVQITPGEYELAAYVVLQDNCNLTNKVRDELKQLIPSSIVPAYIVRVDQLPLTANGKLDKRALPVIEEYKYTEKLPDSSKSGSMLKIWKELFPGKDINPDDRFFDCGGNSLKALQLKIQIQKQYNIDIELGSILANPTVLQFAHSLDGITDRKISSIVKRDNGTVQKLSPQQIRMWILSNNADTAGAYNITGFFRFKKEVDIHALAKSVALLIKKHEILRTCFYEKNGEPFQVVNDTVEVNISEIQTDDISSAVTFALEQEKNFSFDLSQSPLFRITVIKDNSGNTVLVINCHHIITDGWSLKIMMNELSLFYDKFCTGEEISIEEPLLQYSDYCAWLDDESLKDGFKEAENYWKEIIASDNDATSLPRDFNNTEEQNHAGVEYFECSEKLYSNAIKFCNANGITLFTLLLASLEGVLHKYTGRDIITLGTPVHGRGHTDLSEMPGLFVNTIILKNKINTNAAFTDILQQLKDDLYKSYKYQQYPYDKLVEMNSNSSKSLFNIFTSFESKSDEIKLRLNEQEADYELCENRNSKFDANIIFRESNNKISIVIEYNSALFHQKRIKLLGSDILRMLELVLEAHGTKLKDYPLVGLLPIKHKSSSKQPNEYKNIIEQFAETAKLNADTNAVCCNGKCMSYAELDEYSDRVASCLLKEGISNECITGLLLSKSPEMIGCIIGILKAGAAYMPLDPDSPPGRLETIISDSSCSIIICEDNAVLNISGCKPIFLNEITKNIKSKSFKDVPVSPSQLAYVIYTSGSTGTPKGTMIEHHSLVNLVNSLREEVYDRHNKKLNVALQAKYVFDASIQQIFPALVRGDTLHLIDDMMKLNGSKVSAYFEKESIDIADATPTLTDIQLRTGFRLNNSKTLHFLIGGEALPYELSDRLFSACPGRYTAITNMYGPTECCVDTVCYTFTKDECRKTGMVPIGKPMLNTEAYILDKNMQPVQDGYTGELYLSGPNTGRGYLNDSDKTHRSFIKRTGLNGRVLYKTGDLCSMSWNGDIIYMGRSDEQVKMRGYRIELGEIENTLNIYMAPAKCIAAFDNVNREILAFIEFNDGYIDITADALKDIKNNLTDYMFPSAFLQIDNIPLLPSGKPDRSKLVELKDSFNRIDIHPFYEAPQGYVEDSISRIWESVTGIIKPGRNDSFFELGGNSLSALKIIAALSKHFNIELNYSDIFLNETIKKLAVIISGKKEREIKEIPVYPPAEYYPLSHAQKRILLECESGKNAAYIITGGIIIEGSLNIRALNKSIELLLKKHESLRTGFRKVNGITVQYIKTVNSVTAEYIDFSGYEDSHIRVEETVNNSVTKEIDLYTNDAVSFSLYKIAPDSFYLLVRLHHIIADGWSVKIILEELSDSYNSIINGIDPVPETLRVQYHDYVLWYEDLIKSGGLNTSEDYWKEKLGNDFPDVNILPPDKHNHLHGKGQREQVTAFIDEQLTSHIRRFSSERKYTSFMLLLASTALTAFQYSGNDDIIIASPVSGRIHPETFNQTGVYTNTVIFRNKIDKKSKVSEFLRALREEVLETYNHQDYPFDFIPALLKNRKDSKLFSVFVSHESEEDKIHLDLAGLNTRYSEINIPFSKFGLSLLFRENKDNIAIIAEYQPELYSSGYINKLCKDIISSLGVILFNNDILIDSFSRNIQAHYPKLAEDKGTRRSIITATAREKEIAEIWKTIFNNNIGIDDNFFEAGGHSIKALSLISLIKQKYFVNIDLNFVFSFPTISMQAAELDNLIWLNNRSDTGDNGEIVI